MKLLDSSHHSLFTRVCALSAVLAALVITLGSGCETGGKEGDRCNALVLQDECDPGLRCRPATCSEAYCCPTTRSSSDPHCNTDGCPDPDAGEEGGSDASEDVIDGGSDAVGDAGADATTGDGGDGG